MNLWEALKKPFTKDELPDEKKLSADVNVHTNVVTLSDDPYGGSLVVQNDGTGQDFMYYQTGNSQFDYQNNIIQKYRQLVMEHEEVNNAVNIICTEMIYTVNQQEIVNIDIDESNDKIKTVITETFEEILDIINFREKIFHIVRTLYIDGQLNIALLYDKKNVKNGIVAANILEPINLYFDKNERKWKYNKTNDELLSLYSTEIKEENLEYSETEMVHVDFGLYTKVRPNDSSNLDTASNLEYLVNLGYLENAFRTANLLKTLENMLVPLRYSRSVSRRLFNVDVGDLPPKQAREVLDKVRTEFKYKKSYDPETGTIKNIQGTQPMVEDYWFANRSGGKGTTLETMDEKGALMDLEDIRHAARKLYQSLGIPSSRNPYSEDQPVISFNDESINQDDFQFFVFISRLRIPVKKMLMEILRRQLVTKGIFTDEEFKKYKKKINIEFTSEAFFLENAKKQLFMQAIENFGNIKENIGESVSLETAAQMTFGWSSEQLREELENILKEKGDDLFKNFYIEKEEDSGGGW